MPDAQLRDYRCFIGQSGLKIAGVNEAIAINCCLLTSLKGYIMLRLKDMRANDTNIKDYQTEVDHIAAIALTIAFEEHIESKRVGFAMTMTDTSATPEFVEN